MAFKLTYTDGQESDYDDDTKWEVDDGVLKMGREHGKWTVLVSPSHWATIELAPDKKRDKKRDESKDSDKDDEDTDEKDEKKDEDDEDDKDD